uniref:Uncharacterized protein n=1 Tax=Panagrolaimus sp. ES5 TaxID=591445 RepID=A0AC34FEA0_9BILA
MATTSSNSVKNAKYLGFVYGQKKNFCVFVVDPDAQKLVCNTDVEENEIQDFMKNIPTVFNEKFKAVFLNIGGYQPQNYSCNYEFCKEVKAALNSCNIPNHFFTQFQWYFSGLLITSGYIPNVDDYVLFITQFDDEANVFCYKFTENGYINVGWKDVDISEENHDNNIRAEMLEFFPHPSAIFITAATKKMKRLKAIFRNLKVFSSAQDFSFGDPKFISEHSKWFFDKSYTNFYVLPDAPSNVSIFLEEGTAQRPFINVYVDKTHLPFSRTVNAQKVVNYCCVALSINGSKTILERWLPNQNAHEHDVTLSIDEEGFLSYEIKAILWPHVDIFLSKLTKKLKSGIPVIALIENLSFICVRKDGISDYEYLESWNGKFGMDLHISFNEEKPKYCQNAVEAARTKPTFAVFDIFPTMTVAPENIDTIKNYQFKITKDDENPVLLEFDSFDGTRKAASPAFLFAMLLKQHLKAIKNETGKKVKEIALSTFAELDDEELKRVQTQLMEACEMLKISGTFLDFKEF